MKNRKESIAHRRCKATSSTIEGRTSATANELTSQTAKDSQQRGALQSIDSIDRDVLAHPLASPYQINAFHTPTSQVSLQKIDFFTVQPLLISSFPHLS
ncbi:MAG: hypothetical protein J7641_21230 [Cyanobacteria bacterium SID2]|nr:hypothetical protein [Cyanobacteria bacterium SID2]